MADIIPFPPSEGEPEKRAARQSALSDTPAETAQAYSRAFRQALEVLKELDRLEKSVVHLKQQIDFYKKS